MLTEQQKLAAKIMIERPGITQKQLAEEIGCHVNTLYNWRQSSSFNTYLNQLSLEVHNSFIDDTLRMLRKKALDENTRGQVKFMELLLKSFGLLKDTRESTVTVKEEKSEQELLALLDQ